MREILFTGKSKEGDGWVFGVPVRVRENTRLTNRIFLVESVNLDELDYFIPQYYDTEVFPETVGQFSGFYDKNDNKVFEGHIISFAGKNLVAFWNDEAHQWQAKTTMSCPCAPFGSYSLDCEWDCIDFGWFVAEIATLGKTSVEIIGNIYDNPELIMEEGK